MAKQKINYVYLKKSGQTCRINDKASFFLIEAGWVEMDSKESKEMEKKLNKGDK